MNHAPCSLLEEGPLLDEGTPGWRSNYDSFQSYYSVFHICQFDSPTISFIPNFVTSCLMKAIASKLVSSIPAFYHLYHILHKVVRSVSWILLSFYSNSVNPDWLQVDCLDDPNINIRGWASNLTKPYSPLLTPCISLFHYHKYYGKCSPIFTNTNFHINWAQ